MFDRPVGQVIAARVVDDDHARDRESAEDIKAKQPFGGRFRGFKSWRRRTGGGLHGWHVANKYKRALKGCHFPVRVILPAESAFRGRWAARQLQTATDMITSRFATIVPG